MEIILGMLVGVIFGFSSVFFYLMGIRHQKGIKNGSTVKLEPLKAITEPLKAKKEAKEQEERNAKFSNQVNELFAYDGRKKVVK